MTVEEDQALGDAQQDESNVEVFYLDDSLEEAKHWKMRYRMRVKWKYSYLDGRVEEGQELGDAKQNESGGEAFLPG